VRPSWPLGRPEGRAIPDQLPQQRIKAFLQGAGAPGNRQGGGSITQLEHHHTRQPEILQALLIEPGHHGPIRSLPHHGRDHIGIEQETGIEQEANGLVSCHSASQGHGGPGSSGGVIGRLGRHQGEEGVEAGAVGVGGIELESGGEQSCAAEKSNSLPLAFSCLSLAFSCFSRSVSFLICSVSFLICSESFLICSESFLIRSQSILIRSDSFLSSLVRCSISRTGRQLSIDRKDRKGDSDESDAPLLLEGDDPAWE
jgi:hypothetical protein